MCRAGLAPPTPLAEEQSLLFFHADERVQPALLAHLALDAEKRVIDWKIVSGFPVLSYLAQAVTMSLALLQPECPACAVWRLPATSVPASRHQHLQLVSGTFSSEPGCVMLWHCPHLHALVGKGLPTRTSCTDDVAAASRSGRLHSQGSKWTRS